MFPIISAQPSFTPLNLYGIKQWVDAVQINQSGISGGKVATWNDLSGLGNDFIQGTGASQPSYLTNQINGLPAISFVGSQSMIASLAASVSRLVAFTIFIVFKYGGSPPGTLLASNVSASDRMTIQKDGSTSLISATYNGTSYTAKSAVFSNTTNAHIVQMKNTIANAVSQWIDNTSSGGGATPSTGAPSSTYILGSNPSAVGFTGLIAEFILLNRATSAAEDAYFNSYLSLKWGVTIA